LSSEVDQSGRAQSLDARCSSCSCSPAAARLARRRGCPRLRSRRSGLPQRERSLRHRRARPCRRPGHVHGGRPRAVFARDVFAALTPLADFTMIGAPTAPAANRTSRTGCSTSRAATRSILPPWAICIRCGAAARSTGSRARAGTDHGEHATIGAAYAEAGKAVDTAWSVTGSTVTTTSYPRAPRPELPRLKSCQGHASDAARPRSSSTRWVRSSIGARGVPGTTSGHAPLPG